MKFALTLTFLFSALIGTSFKTFAGEMWGNKSCAIYYKNLMEDRIINGNPEGKYVKYVVYKLIEKGYSFVEEEEKADIILSLKLKTTPVKETSMGCEQSDVQYNTDVTLAFRDHVNRFKGESFCIAPNLVGAYVIPVTSAVESIPDCE